MKETSHPPNRRKNPTAAPTSLGSSDLARSAQPRPQSSSGVRGELLTRVFRELEGYGDRKRWEEALEECERRGLL